MKKGLAFLAICAAFAAVPAWAQTPANTEIVNRTFVFTEDTVDEWMETYYVRKDVDDVADFLRFTAGSTKTQGNEGAVVPMAAFLAEIFRANPTRIDDWLKAADFKGTAREIVAEALWYNGDPRLRAFDPAADARWGPPVRYNQFRVTSGSDEDRMWGAFMASGDAQYVNKIVDVLDDTRPLSDDPKMDLSVRAAAKWSLGSNMEGHELIVRLLRSESARRTGPAKAAIDGLLRTYDSHRIVMDHSDGPFTAQMAMISRDNLSEFDKPSNQGVVLERLDTAKVGDVVIAKILFAEMELTDDLDADVDFDIKVTAPDGSVYSGMDHTGLPALKGRLATAHSFYDNQEMVGIRFEAKDPPGVYHTHVVLHDRVGHHDIPLDTDIELKK